MLIPFGENQAASPAKWGQQSWVRGRMNVMGRITSRGTLEKMLSVH